MDSENFEKISIFLKITLEECYFLAKNIFESKLS